MNRTTTSSENENMMSSAYTTNIPKIAKSVFVFWFSFVITELVILVITSAPLYFYPFVRVWVILHHF